LHLAWFLPYIWLRCVWVLLLRRTDVIYFGDGVACAVAPFLLPLKGGARFVATVFGAEMTFGSARAQSLMRKGAQCCDRIVVISENSRRLAVEWGLLAERIEIIYVGVEPALLDPARDEELQREFEGRHGLSFAHSDVVLNLSRQVPRKGLVAFLEHGFAHLRDDITLIIVGDGPELPRLREAQKSAGTERILLLGAVDDETAAMLRSNAGLFIMPNVPLADDVEGYGIAPLESMFVGTPVVAFAVDALVESIREGGYLVESGDYAAFAGRIHEFFALSEGDQRRVGDAAREYVTREYGWDLMADHYESVLSAD
jgi:phosphatidylinositol alpha-1,6-mannosyltransferase